MRQFSELGLSEKGMDAVARLGYEAPTMVQEQGIPLVLSGRDVIAAAKTGTGKTAAFALPCLDRLGRSGRGQGPLMLVVTPTRELAQQIGEVCQTISVSTHHRVLTVVGGLSYNPQIDQLGRGVDVLIATPGRLMDLMDRGAVSLDAVRALVIDEADRMLDMGFWPTVRKIVAATPHERQTMLFSATIDESVTRHAQGLLRDPAIVQIAHRGDTADTVEQYVIHTQQAVKPALLKGLLAEKGFFRVIVFTRTRGRADATCRRLVRAGFAAEAIHSSRSQAQRRRALDHFADGSTNVIVATDVLARGIDVEQVDYVVNYDLPTQPEDYVHRIGRTGRAGATGFAVSFVTPDTADALADIEKLIKRRLPELELKEFDMAAAEQEAQAKAQRADARRDPELQQAAREQAARERKKAKARAKAQEQAEQKAQAAGKKQHKKKTASRSSQPAQKGARHADNRPGRAHRADVARRRGESSKKRH